MKAGREHRVPLSERALEIRRTQQELATGRLVFEGGRDDSAISDTAMTKALRAAGAGAATLHGLSPTFRDWAGDATHHPREVGEAALAHVLGDETERAYCRSDALAKRRALMDDWANYCSSTTKY